MDVRSRIRAYFDTAIVESINDDEDIFEGRYVDSMFALQLVTFVEEEFSIVVEREDLDIQNFVSVSAITSFVESKLATSR